MRTLLSIHRSLALASALLACHRDDTKAAQHEWSYEASDWTRSFPECGGAVESPIDIQTAHTVKAALPALEVHYGRIPLAITNNGHTVVVRVPAGSSIALDGASVPLAQFHFHHKSEHQIDGASFDAELHLVHQDGGNTVVLGVLLRAGRAHPELAKVLDHLPVGKDREEHPDGTLDLAALLSADLGYYNYTGSLTTPPCTEGVDWIVLKTPVEVSAEQLAALAKLFDNNRRPTQPLHHRPVLESL